MNRSRMQRLRTALRLPPSDWMLVIEAGAELLRCSAREWLLGSERSMAMLGRPSPVAGIGTQVCGREALAKRIGWALRAANRVLPWHSRCLIEAAAGRRMLRRRGLPARVTVGMANDPVKGLHGHAWLHSGECWITGREGSREFKPLAVYH